MGRLIAQRGIDLVYGGGHVGLMGELADAALAAGGRVHGVITHALHEKEIAHSGLTTLDVVDTMHDRKAAMADAAEAFIMLPGGYGTFEEFFEVVTWTQLGVHSKACGVLNVKNFFDPLLALLDTATDAHFLRREHRDIVIVDTEIDALLARLGSWRPVVVDKWIDRRDR